MWQYTPQLLVERNGQVSEHECVCVIMHEIITPGCKHHRDENNNALPTAQLTTTHCITKGKLHTITGTFDSLVNLIYRLGSPERGGETSFSTDSQMFLLLLKHKTVFAGADYQVSHRIQSSNASVFKQNGENILLNIKK